MDQQQFRVRFPLWKKLLGSLTAVTLLLVVFLSATSILLIQDDKRAYVYQLQLMEAMIGGQSWSRTLRLSQDTLKQYMSSFDPNKPLGNVQNLTLANLVRNQDQGVRFGAYWLDKSGKVTVLAENLSEKIKSGKRFTIGLAKYASSLFQEKSLVWRIPEENFIAFGLVDQQAKGPAGEILVGVAVLDPEKISFSHRIGQMLILNRLGELVISSDSDTKMFGYLNGDVGKSILSSPVHGGSLEYSFEGHRYVGAYQKNEYGVVFHSLAWERVFETVRRLAWQLIWIGLLAIATAVLFSLFFSRGISEPLKRLYEAVRKVGEGQFDVDPKVKTEDEVGQLSNAFLIMSKRISGLLDEVRNKAQLEEELKIAAAVQENLLPEEDIVVNNIKIKSLYRPANHCGGDWWGYFEVDRVLYLIIADATGHGVSSALMTAATKSATALIQNMIYKNLLTNLSPGRVLSFLNEVIRETGKGRIMMTMLVARIDLDRGIVDYANAGHNPAWLLRKDGSGTQLKSLMADGQRLGESENEQRWEEKTEKFHQDDIILFYTDGLIENKDQTGRAFGKKKAREIFEDSGLQGPDAIIQRFTAELNAFGTNAVFEDDITLLAVQGFSS